jgi:hypothetical protein
MKKIVLALNKLNEKCEYSLLETDEREMICDIINKSAKKAGIEEADEDLTAEYREW